MLRPSNGDLAKQSVESEQASEKSSIWEKIKDNFALFVVIALGVFGAFWGIADVWMLHKEASNPEIVARLSQIRFLVSVTLTILSALSVVVGIELFSQFRRLNRHLSADEFFAGKLESKLSDYNRLNEQIKNSLEQYQTYLSCHLGGRLIQNKRQISKRVLELATQAQSEIKLLVYGTDWLETATDEWTQKLAQHIKEITHADMDFLYQIVAFMPINPDNQKNFFERVKRRVDIYLNEGVGKYLDLQFIDGSKPIGLNLIIVDSKHTAITFSSNGMTDVNSCVIFEDNEKISSLFKSWFDNAVYRSATIPDKVTTILPNLHTTSA